jgi:hypothetical protein
VCAALSCSLINTSGCAAGYKGDRCEIKHTGTATKQTCTPPETGGACQNGSKCNLNSAGFIYCSGVALYMFFTTTLALTLHSTNLTSATSQLCCLTTLLNTALHARIIHQAALLAIRVIVVRSNLQAVLLSKAALLLRPVERARMALSAPSTALASSTAPTAQLATQASAARSPLVSASHYTHTYASAQCDARCCY